MRMTTKLRELLAEGKTIVKPGAFNALSAKIIEQAGFKEAVDYLYFLAGKRFFWNRVIRNKAQEILKKWKY